MSIYQENQKKILSHFKDLSPNERYEKLFFLAEELPSFPKSDQREEYLVPGCQSRLYLKLFVEKEKITILADSDSLFTKGLAALFVHLYQDTPIETLFTEPLSLFQKIGFSNFLSLQRSQGVLSMLRFLQKQASPFIKVNI